MGGKHTLEQYDFLPKSGQISKGGSEQVLSRARRAEGIKRPKAVQIPSYQKLQSYAQKQVEKNYFTC